tara:strand:- start:74 stop:991 length:918 start_codon:yes stop_codon:yes gene_type:complete
MEIGRLKIKFFIIFLNILFVNFLGSHLKTYAEYDLKNITKKTKSFPRIKLQEEDIRYPMNFNSDIGDFIVVKVFGSSAPGNGVLIAQRNKYYYAITAKHIVEDVLEGDDIELQTLDSKYHIGKLLKKSINYDSALIKFKSMDFYYTAFIRPDVTPYKGQAVELVGYSLPSNAVDKISLRKTFGTITGVLDRNKDGYAVLYSNATNIGMSGSAVLTYPMDGAASLKMDGSQTGSCHGFLTPSLVAIHGRGEEYVSGGKSGVNLGISIHDLLAEFQEILLNENIETLPEETDTKIWNDGCLVFKKPY